PISHHVEGAPPELERIVKKALRKDRNERYQIVKEMAIDLRSLRASTTWEKATDIDDLKQLGTDFVESFVSRNQPWLPWIVGILAVAGAIFGSFYPRTTRTEPKLPVPFERVEVTKLTTNGNAVMGAISPDGKYVAYVTGESGKQSLWLRQVDINSNAQLVAPRAGHYLGLAFSPDGNYIYFGYAESARNDAGQIYRLPVLGIGATATRIDLQAGPPNLSHDHKRMAFIRFDRQAQTDSLIIANADGGGEQVVGTR